MRFQVVALCAVFGIATAALGLAKLETKPDKHKDEEGCFIAELDAVIPFGEARPSKENCLEYRCGDKWVQLVSCGVVAVSPPYELVEHTDQPYPRCCPMVKEDELDSTTTAATDAS